MKQSNSGKHDSATVKQLPNDALQQSNTNSNVAGQQTIDRFHDKLKKKEKLTHQRGNTVVVKQTDATLGATNAKNVKITGNKTKSGKQSIAAADRLSVVVEDGVEVKSEFESQVELSLSECYQVYSSKFYNRLVSHFNDLFCILICLLTNIHGCFFATGQLVTCSGMLLLLHLPPVNYVTG